MLNWLEYGCRKCKEGWECVYFSGGPPGESMECVYFLQIPPPPLPFPATGPAQKPEAGMFPGSPPLPNP